MLKKISLVLLFVCCFNAQAQTENDSIPTDSIQTGGVVGTVQLKTPKSVSSTYKYDPLTDRYIYSADEGTYSVDNPIILTPEEYEKLLLKESSKDYFKGKRDAIDGQKDISDAVKKDLLPRYYVNSGFFESVFGSNTIDVKPTGTVDIDLGMRYTKQDNPAISTRNQTNYAFDFDQRISLSLSGKVGTRLKVTANYDNKSTFDFQNIFKLEYTPTEDDIIQKIEVGNISMPINSTLIRGVQSLFGVKTQLQFGKTKVTGVFSEQKSQTKKVVAEGGGSVEQFEIFALDYDADKHFFLSQYFRNKYDKALKSYPFIDSRVQITRVEVWVTNKQNRVNSSNNNLRNIIALQDLGEAQLTGLADNEVVVADPPTGIFNNPIDSPPDNKNNDYDPKQIEKETGLLNKNIREIATSGFGFNGITPIESRDYAKLENAKKLTTTEFTFHPQLGYISLSQKLSNDEILAVAYEYTIGDNVYQVGEFGNDGLDPTQVTETQEGKAVVSQTLILKMLKSTLINTKDPVWNLMMKNIYQIPGGYNLKQEDFRFNILYSDPSPLNYITPVAGTSFPENPLAENAVAETPLLNVFNLDKLNYNNDPQKKGDGFFDFLQGVTVDTQNGRLIFTTKEPFGELIFSKLNTNTGESFNDETSYNPNQKKYVFRSMYRNTQSAALQNPENNKFLLKGKFKSSTGDGIPIGAFNVPQGSVKVSAAGRVLQEGIDYRVNYQAGRVYILDPSIQSSNVPIEISLENNSVFGQQTTRFVGVNIEHKFNENFLLGTTILNLNQRPFTQKSDLGQESVNNTIYGMNSVFSTEVPFFTRLANKLPNVWSTVPSKFSIKGEIAALKPGVPSQQEFNGESTIYVDDFEGAQTTINMASPLSWHHSSTPEVSPKGDYDFNSASLDLSYNYKRAKLAWYTIDPSFYTESPKGITKSDISLNTTRRVYIEELYPITDVAQGQPTVVNTLDLTYYPKDRGPYNNNTNFSLNPKENYGGIMRSISTTNFEQGNVEYLQFWLMDPYIGKGSFGTANSGKIYFQLGEISEDILKDGRKQYENGLGTDQIMVKPRPIWGEVPASQSLIYAFDNNATTRGNQDVGLDGLNNQREIEVYNNFATEADPAADDYTFYMNSTGGILQRYKNYNGVDGNSAVSIDDPNRGSTSMPDVEDINRDNTMNTINAYYEYSIDVKPSFTIGENYVTDIRNTQVTLADGTSTDSRWIQFKIPISQPESVVGNISDFRSIRFMRMFMTKFESDITVRFGSMDLVRGEWRRYANTLDPRDTNVDDDGTTFDVFNVNIEENNTRCPVNYVSPPNVLREQMYYNNTVVSQNEQSLALKISGRGIEPEDLRGVFKNVSVDMRQYNNLKMFIHAESLPEALPLDDGQLIGFIRLGNDFNQNFYQIEIPLKVTQPSSNTSGSGCPSTSSDLVWPAENEIDLALELLTQIKIQYSKIDPSTLPLDGIYYQEEGQLDPTKAGKPNKLRIGIKGNPNFGMVRTLMLGVKNSETRDKLKGEVWFNELRLADMKNEGGMAAVLGMDTNFADFATLSATGSYSGIGFGSIEQGVNERRREDLTLYNIATNVNIGQLLPKKARLKIPFGYAIGEEFITPEYDPLNLDIKLKDLLDATSNSAEKKAIEDRAIDYTKRQSINFIGVKRERADDQKKLLYDIENFTFSQSYNQVNKHDFEVEKALDRQTSTTLNYAYGVEPKSIEPLRNNQYLRSKNSLQLIRDFNFSLFPSSLTFESNIKRQHSSQTFRQIDVEGIAFSPLQKRNFSFNYNYGFNYNLTKSLSLTYNASATNVVKNYMASDDEPIEDFDIFQDYLEIGIPNIRNQRVILNYDIPINKIPAFKFIKASYAYNGDYMWQKSSDAMSKVTIEGVEYNMGNTVQNSNSNIFNTSFDMNTFYDFIGLRKNTKKAPPPPAGANVPLPGQKITSAPEKSSPITDGGKGLLMCIKNFTFNYTETNGTVLPGYLPSVGFWGSSLPSVPFVFGLQDDVREEAARNGWLTTYKDFNQNYTTVNQKTYKFITNVTLLPDLKIDLNLDKATQSNYSEQYDVSDGIYNSRSPYTVGNYNISTILIGTAFSTSDEVTYPAFETFRNNRIVIANRLAAERGIDINNPSNLDKDGFPAGYGKNNQAVLLPAFLAAYSNSNASGISLSALKNAPLPNWGVRYSGLMRLQLFKENFKRFNLQHNYRATYTVNNYRSNFAYDKDPNGLDDGGNFYNQTIMSNVNLIEQFKPLMRVEFELKNSLRFNTEVAKDRALSMSFDNNLLTEVAGNEYLFGVGYRVKDVTFASKLADNTSGVIRSDINLKTDISYRKNQTIVRYLDYDNNKLASGQNIWRINFTADYSFSKSLMMIFYYDHSFSDPVVSTSFPLTTIRTGFTIRYTFGN